MEKQERFRNFACITYMSEEELGKFLEEYKSHINHYAWAVHDKDENENHIHIVIMWYNALTVSALRKRFSKYSNQNTLAQPLLSKCGAFEYLTHSDEESKESGKYQYDKSIIKCDSDSFWNSAIYEEDNAEDDSFQIIADLICGVPLAVIHKRYGQKFVLNYAKYRDFATAVRNEERANNRPKLVDEQGEVIPVTQLGIELT